MPTRSTAELLEPPPPNSPEALLDEARDQADALRVEAEAEIEDARRTATEEGFAQGNREATEQLASTLATVRSLVEQLDAERERRPEAAADEVAIVALEVAARIVRAELDVRPERVLDVIRGAIRRASERGRLLVRVHPDDLDLCREAVPDLLAQIGGVDRLDIVEEPRVPCGSCLLETPAGDIDATFATQLERLLAALAEPPDGGLVEPAA